MQEAEAKRQAALNTVRTKTAERNARVAQKKATVDMAPEAPASKPVFAPALLLPLMCRMKLKLVTTSSPTLGKVNYGIPCTCMS